MAAVKGNGLIIFHCYIQQWNKTKQMNTHTHTQMHTYIYIHTDMVQNDYNNCPRLSWLYYLMAMYEDCRVGKAMIPLKDVFSEYV